MRRAAIQHQQTLYGQGQDAEPVAKRQKVSAWQDHTSKKKPKGTAPPSAGLGQLNGDREMTSVQWGSCKLGRDAGLEYTGYRSVIGTVRSSPTERQE